MEPQLVRGWPGRYQQVVKGVPPNTCQPAANGGPQDCWPIRPTHHPHGIGPGTRAPLAPVASILLKHTAIVVVVVGRLTCSSAHGGGEASWSGGTRMRRGAVTDRGAAGCVDRLVVVVRRHWAALVYSPAWQPPPSLALPPTPPPPLFPCQPPLPPPASPRRFSPPHAPPWLPTCSDH